MGLVRMFSRQAVRAAGASLIAPIVLLLAVGVLTSGGGLGGLDSLGQIASGPSLPDTGLPRESTSSIKGAEIVGTALPPAGERESPAPAPETLASATPPAPAPPPAEAASARAEPEARLRTERRRVDLPPAGPGNGAPLNEAEGDSPAAGANPVEEIEETTRGLGEALSEPLRPVTNQLLDILRLLRSPGR